MEINEVKSALKTLSITLFEHELISSFSASMSMRFDNDSFMINKHDIFFNTPTDNDFMLLRGKKDYIWKDATKDALIHQNIYKNISIAKFACYCAPPYISAYALEHSSFEPKDTLGKDELGSLFVYDTKQSDNWSERAPSEIVRYFLQNNTNIVILRGGGVCVYERSMRAVVRTLSMLENSAKLIAISKNYQKI